MAYGMLVNVPAPIEMYDAVNAQITEQIGEGPPPGLLVHIARKTPEGFQVIELWESKQQAETFGDDVLGPTITRVAGDQAPRREDIMQEFDAHNFFVGEGAAAASAR
jgi:hypothetical protein